MRRTLSAALPLALCIALFPACGKMGKKKDIPGPNDKVYSVSTASVESRNIPDSIEIKGTFTQSQRLLFKSDFTGKVQALSVIEGQQVNTGDALLKIDDEKLPYVLDRQRAELREAEAQLELDTKSPGAGGEDVVEEQPEVPNNEENANNPPPGGGDENAPDQPEQNAEASPNPGMDQNQATPSPYLRRPFGVQFPRRPLLPGAPPLAANRRLGPDNSENRITLDQAKIDRVKAEVALSEHQLTGSTVLATIDGFVSKVSVAEGSMVKPDDPLVEIIKADPIELTLQIPKEDLGRLDKTMEVKINAPDLGPENLDGEISYIGAEIDPVKKTLELRVRIPNPGLRLKVGLDGVARLAIANKTHQALLVPSQAVRGEGDKKIVYVVRGQLAELREVETGNNVEGMIEVKKGLKNGERVITSGVEALKEDEEFVKVSS